MAPRPSSQRANPRVVAGASGAAILAAIPTRKPPPSGGTKRLAFDIGAPRRERAFLRGGPFRGIRQYDGGCGR